jgi:hypothetical protein
VTWHPVVAVGRIADEDLGKGVPVEVDEADITAAPQGIGDAAGITHEPATGLVRREGELMAFDGLASRRSDRA